MISNEALIVLGLIALVLLVGVAIFLWWAGSSAVTAFENWAAAPSAALGGLVPSSLISGETAGGVKINDSIGDWVSYWWNDTSSAAHTMFQDWFGTPPAAVNGTPMPTDPAQLAGTAPSGEVDPGSAGPAGSIAGFNYLPSTSPTGTGGDS